MVTAILATKLYIPPTRPELVPRPRLIGRLNEGLHHRLTLISAPAGFGKTTLVSEWLQLSDLPTTWFSLDEGDNDLTCFLTYFISALQQIAPNIGQTVQSMLQSPQPPLTETLVSTLINEISASFTGNRCVFVLDDYHVIEAQPIHKALTFFLDHLPPQMHFVIVGRADPPLFISRLRARNQLTEIRSDDLRFTLDEITTFLDEVMDLKLSAAEVTVLEARTEGWIAGLQLAALSMQGSNDSSGFINSFTGSHRYIIDYLTDEVLHQQAPEINEFLLQTSILKRMTAPLCNAVTGREDGQTTLERLEAANLFLIPLDNERCWYRYHHLFSDLLRQRLHQEQPEQVTILHCQASVWYEHNGFHDEAIEHALCSEDFERTSHLIEEHVDAILKRGEQLKLRRWLNGLPVDLISTKPQLCILHAWELFTAGEHSAAERRLQAVEQVLDPGTDHVSETSPIERGQLPGTDRMKLRGMVATIRSFLASHRGDVPAIIQYSRQALEYLPEQDLSWRSTATIALGDAYSFEGDMAAAYRVRLEGLEASKVSGNIYMMLIASLKLAITLRQQGRLQRVIEICRQKMQLAGESGMSQTVMVGWLLAIWGEVLAELNDLDGAIDHAKKGVELTEYGGDVAMLGWSCLCLTRVLLSRGDVTGAEEIIQKMENTAREYDVPPWITNLMAAWQGRILLAQEKPDAASLWMQERGLDADGELTILHEMEYIVLARILIAQGRLDEAARLLQCLLEVTEAGGRTSRAIEILMLQALAFQAGGDTAMAVTTLERAFTLAEPGGFIRIFIDEGPPMAGLLSEAAAHGIMPDYTGKLLAAFEAEEERSAGKSPLPIPPPSQSLIEPLSQRELEVLGLIAQGLSNHEIGERLFIALDTVKGHNRRIYSKLNVENRAQAINKARSLNILPPQ